MKGTLVDTVAERVFGFTVGNIIAAFTIVSIAASISAMVLAGPRVYFAMGRDGLFTEASGRVHPRFRAPVSAIATQAVWSGVLVLCGSLSQLVSYTGFAVVLFSGIAVAALFVLRAKDGAVERPFRAWGYPVAPAVFGLGGPRAVRAMALRGGTPARHDPHRQHADEGEWGVKTLEAIEERHGRDNTPPGWPGKVG